MKKQSKITVRLDAELRAAEVELVTPHDQARVEGLEHVFRQMGLHPMHTIELSTPKYRVTRTKLREQDGAVLDSSRLVEVLRVVRERELDRASWTRHRAA